MRGVWGDPSAQASAQDKLIAGRCVGRGHRLPAYGGNPAGRCCADLPASGAASAGEFVLIRVRTYSPAASNELITFSISVGVRMLLTMRFSS